MTSLLFCSFQDLKEKKEVVEETENGRDAPANGNAVSMTAICWESQSVFLFSSCFCYKFVRSTKRGSL